MPHSFRLCAIGFLAAATLALGAAVLHAAQPPAAGQPASSTRSSPITALALTGDVTAQQPAVVSLASARAGSAAALEAELSQTCYSLALDRFATAQLDAFAVPGWQSQMYTVQFTSSDKTVCLVDASGLVTGVGPGEAVITATATDASGSSVSATCQVTVTEAAPPITALELVRTKVTLRMGGTGSDLTITGCQPAQYLSFLEQAPTYTSSDEAVCTVDESGHITAVAPGEAVVTVSLYGVTADCAVTVEDKKVSLTGGIQLLDFPYSNITAIGSQTPGRCSWYAMRYARTIADGSICSGRGMWSNGAVWSAGGFSDWSGSLDACLDKLYSELNAGRPVIVHLKNTTVSGVKKHSNRLTTYEYHANGAGGWEVVEYPHVSTSAVYGHWVCIVGYAADADPNDLKESDFYALDPARVTLNGRLVLTRLLDGTLWTGNSPLKLLG